ncbi:SDR family oxidoreductase [Archangium violaceum]|uniref:SDR family oxidoreductase n=1 Tax=Archangium violaceum TaxID=83451 RepID=UPI00194EFF7B|nr:SDR family oxidoreductase [Archangium violaceum]QRN95927.1 SDR family oxidoreductase [Archangium violaceum]
MAQKNPRDAGVKPPLPGQEQAHPGIEAQMTPEPDYGLTSYKGLGRLKDRVALVTGGDSGIGRAVCLAFAREGADVAFAYLNEDPDAEQTRRVVEDSGHQVLALKGDLTDEAVCRRIIEDTVKRFGRIDVLVNNAAFQGKAVEKFEELTAERIERTFRTNILAMFHLVRYALPHMKSGASIINVASIQAYQPSPGILDYASTKGAIVTFTKGLAQELIERGIRVNSVAPGPVWTPLIPQSFDAEKVKSFGKSSPMGRPAQPVELAPSFVFLASDESRYVNGEILGVTGGQVLA